MKVDSPEQESKFPEISEAPVSEQSKKRKRHADRRCPYCGALKLDRQPVRGPSGRLLTFFSIFPYRCRKCLRNANKFSFSPAILLVLVLMGGLAAGAVWIYTILPFNRFQQNTEAPTHVEAADGVRSNMGQLSPFEKMMVSKHQQTMDNETIIRLTKANIGTPIILKMIRNSNHEFDVSAQAIISLKAGGVDESVIFTMLDVTSDPR
jgi:hypothetical protein